MGALSLAVIAGQTGAAPPADDTAVVATTVGVALSFLAAGVIAWRAQPGDAVGRMLIVVGLLWVFAKFPLPLPALRGAYALTGGAWAAGLAHLVVAYPTGRLTAPAPRAVAALSYVSVAVVGVLALTAPHPVPGRAGVVATVAIGLAVIGLQVRRWQDSSVAGRRAIGPVVAAAVAATTLLVVLKPVLVAAGPARWLLPLLQIALAAVPLAILGTLLRRRLDRGGVADLLVRLGAAPAVQRLRPVLAEVLHDPTLRVGCWMPEQGGYVDVDGWTTIPAGDPDRAVTPIDVGGRPLAVLVHDPALLEDRPLVDGACAAVALALRNERLSTDVQAQLRQLANSRSNAAKAAAVERRRLERDLHDGLQQRLLSIPMTLALAESALHAGPERAGTLIREAKHTSLAVLDEVRALVHGVHPPVLTERGLAGAVRELAASTAVPVRLAVAVPDPVPVETETTAYFVVAEALANVTRHADAGEVLVTIGQVAGRLRIEVRDNGCGGADPALGSGLRGLAGRVADRGGSFEVDSPVGGGTRIRVALPCG